MSDILIKNMEMPSCCGLCPCFHAEHPMYCQADKTIRMTAPYGKRMEGCPLVALPEHKKAYWKNAMCSNCGAVRLVSASGNFYYVNYCHNCGAEIVEATE